MPLAVSTLEELDKLQGLKARGVILERQYEVIKKHIMEGNSLTTENWKAFELAWKLKTNGGFSEEEWTTQIDGDISVIRQQRSPFTFFTARFYTDCDSSDEDDDGKLRFQYIQSNFNFWFCW